MGEPEARDGKSHMAYGNYLTGCPASHPVAMPAITMNFKWRLAGKSTAGWRLSSDVVGAPAGSSAHAGWFLGWDRDTLSTFITRCVNASLDCSTYYLGDGRMLTGADARQ